MKIAILYHRADLDGVLSGVIAAFYMGHRHDVVDVFGLDYHDVIGDATFKKVDFCDAGLIQYDQIYVIDFSHDALFNNEAIQSKIIWIDHHKSAIEKYKDYPIKRWCIDGVAACRLTFQFFSNLNYTFLTKRTFFYREVEEPLFVCLAGEYDIWDLDSPSARPLNFGIADLSFDNVKKIFCATKCILVHNEPKNRDESRLEELDEAKQLEGWESKLLTSAIKRGQGVIDYIKSYSVRMPVNKCIIDGRVARVFNTSIKSSLIHELQEDEDLTIVWYHIGGTKVLTSFYSTKVDCSLIAKQYGGGGHAGAAGATMEFATLSSIIFNQVK